MRYLNYWLLLCLVLLAGCEKEEIATRSFPRLETLPVTNVSDEGAVFNGHVLSSEGQDVLHHGFVWGDRGRLPQLSTSFVISEPGAPSKAEFSMEIRNDLEIGRFYLIRAYIQTEQLTIYGNEVLFQSLGSRVPVLTSVQPAQGSWGDTITVRGKFLSRDTTNGVAFLGEVPVPVISASDSLASFVIPPTPNKAEVPLRMVIGGVSSQNQLPFANEVVEILEIIPASPTFLETTSIKFKNLNEAHFEFLMQDKPVPNITVFEDSIVFQIPLEVDDISPQIEIRSAGFEDQISVLIKEPEVEKLFGRTIAVGQTVRLYVKDIYPILEDNFLWINGIRVPVQDYRNDSLFFVIPEVLPPLPNLSAKLISGPFELSLGRVGFEMPRFFDLPSSIITGFQPQVTFRGENLKASGNLTARIRWAGGFYELTAAQIQNLSNDEVQIQFANTFYTNSLLSTNEDITLSFLVEGRILRSFELKLRYESAWTKQSKLPFAYGSAGLLFSFGEKFFIGKGLVDGDFIGRFYLYDTVRSSWQRYRSGTNIPTTAYPAVFKLADQVYMTTGTRRKENNVFVSHSESYVFDSETLNWTTLLDFPGTPRYDAQIMMHGSTVYLIGGKNDGLSASGQTALAREIWEFIPATNTWVQLEMEVPAGMINAVSVDGQGYVSVQDGFYRFDRTNWTKIEVPSIVDHPPIIIGQHAYWGFGNGSRQTIGQYNFTTGEYQQLRANFPDVIDLEYLFTIDGQAYFIALYSGLSQQLLTFDPTRL